MDLCRLIITALLYILSGNFNLYAANLYTILFKHLYSTSVLSMNQNLKTGIVILNSI